MKTAILSAIFGVAMMAPAGLAVPLAEPSDVPFSPPTDIKFSQVEDAGVISGPVNGTLDARGLVGYFQAFSGAACDGGIGGIMSFSQDDFRCIDTRDRHSFRITGNCAYVNADSYEYGANCPGKSTSQQVGNGCYSVDTGSNWQSMRVVCRG